MSRYFGYGDLTFSWGDHICAIFQSHVQQREIMGAFIAEGVRAGQRCIWVAPERSIASLRSFLAEAKGDPAAAESSGQLLLIPEVEFYLVDGIFEPGRTMELIDGVLRENARDGYSETRITSDVSWLDQGRLSPELWQNFESRLTDAVSSRPIVMVCQYGRRQLSGSLLGAALYTHPTVILGDAVHRNPFYQAAALRLSAS